MRDNGATHARVGDLELTLTPESVPVVGLPGEPLTEEQIAKQKAAEIAAHRELLFASSET